MHGLVPVTSIDGYIFYGVGHGRESRAEAYIYHVIGIRLVQEIVVETEFGEERRVGFVAVIVVLGCLRAPPHAEFYGRNEPVEEWQLAKDVDRPEALSEAVHKGVEDIYAYIYRCQQGIHRTCVHFFLNGVEFGKEEHRLLKRIAMLVVVVERRLLGLRLVHIHRGYLAFLRRQCQR